MKKTFIVAGSLFIIRIYNPIDTILHNSIYFYESNKYSKQSYIISYYVQFKRTKLLKNTN